ncbi:MAG: NAD(P)-binding protein [Alphaproteobacteria bacterium]|nr:NAD(P)-binding protein [Alphaproteobacteria bacterium]
MTDRIAIIGAGLSGLILARSLSHHADVTVFEKARGVGGRMSTRYADPFYFDHGTDKFTARTPAFQNFIKPYLDAGIIQAWQGKVVSFHADGQISKRQWFEPHYVACPRMNSFCHALAEGIDVKTQIEIAPLSGRSSQGWHLQDKDGQDLGVFNWVISTAPPAQTHRLFQGVSTGSFTFQDVRMEGCYSLMIGFQKPWDKTWIAAKVHEGLIDWISVNSSKPGRDDRVTSIVAYSTHDWAEKYMDADMGWAQKELIASFEQVTDISCEMADHVTTHRWKYAIAQKSEDQKEHISTPFLDTDLRIAAVSDWASASRIENVWESAMSFVDVYRRAVFK